MLFSVIIPCFNSQDTIKRALSSVINQSLKEFEIIIVDDGSTDKTKNIINNFFKDKRIVHQYIYQENKGASSARNNAIKNSKGKYLAFLDADDEWHKDKLKIQYRYMQILNINFISCLYTYENFPTITDIKVTKYNFKNFLYSNRTSTPCTIVSRELFDCAGGFKEGQRYSEDYYLWLKISSLENLIVIKAPLVRLYKRAYGDSGLSSRLWKMEKEELNNYQKLYSLRYVKLPIYVSCVVWSFTKFIMRSFKVAVRRSFK